MADINKLVPFILKWEGGYVDDPNDLGGPTNKGVTLKVWQQVGYDKNNDGVIDEEDLKMLFQQDLIECVLRPHYWNRWQADRIHNQSVAHLLVDWIWASGIISIKITQRLLDLEIDGIVGVKTLAAINQYPDQKELFERIKAERVTYIERICEQRPANRRYKKGWMNRLNDIKFAYIALAIFLTTCLAGCKTAATSETARLDTTTTLHSDGASEQQTKAQSDVAFSKYADSMEDTETLMEKTVILFPPNPLNSTVIADLTRNPLIQAVSITRTLHRKAARTSVRKEEETHRTDSTLVHRRETTDRKTAGHIEVQKKTKTFSSPFRLAAVIVLLLAAIAAFQFFRKKRTPFFML